ncbi:MAG: transcriptional regulator [Chloroflexi bacterium]|nr:transcriptional regulator [Chloroflexota bacterium]
MEERPIPTRTVRLARLQHLLFRNARGLTSADLAEITGRSRRTIERDIRDLGDAGVPVWQNGNRYGIASDHFLPPVHLTLHEAGALFLAARLLCRYSDERNPHVVNALAKLAGVLPDSVGPHVQQATAEVGAREEKPEFTRVFETLVTAWALRRKVKVWHQSAHSEHVHDYIFQPYAIEPIGGGNSTYVIGYADYFDAVRTFKVERIQRAELMLDEFAVPADFDLSARLGSSWGIMWGDAEVEVRCRFSPRVVRRLKETIWHSSQLIEDQPDGSCLFTVKVGNALEMVPWLRGWGPDCEVLAPEALRRDMAEWARETAGVYEVQG